MRIFLLSICLLQVSLVSYANIKLDKSKLDSTIRNLNFEGYMMPVYIHAHDFNRFQFSYFRLKSFGMVTKHLGYYIQFDFSQSPTLKDASVDIKLRSYYNIRVGQFQYHFGVYEKPWNFPTIFAPQIKRIMLGDPRDMGVQFSGSFSNLDYYACVMNGTARGVPEDDKKKTLVFSFDYNIGSNFKIGISQYWGTRNFNDELELVHGARRNRSGVYFWYQDRKLMFRGEYMTGMDHSYNQNGHYFIGGYHITRRLQPVFRYDFFESEINDARNQILAPGLNVFFNEKLYLRSIVEFQKRNNHFEYRQFALQLGVMFL